MSTHLVFSSKRGLRARDDPKNVVIGRSSVELDTVLLKERKHQTSNIASNVDLDRGAKESSESPARSLRKGLFQFPKKVARSSLPTTTTQSIGQEVDHSSGSVSSNTIMSRDITESSDNLIANMEQVKDSESLHSVSVMSSPLRASPRFKSRSSCHGSKRGISLEREIRKTIQLSSLDSSDFLNDMGSKSAKEILNDLEKAMEPLHGCGFETGMFLRQSQSLRENGSLLDGDDDGTIQAEFPEDFSSVRSPSDEDGGCLSNSSSYSVDLPYISSEETLASSRPTDDSERFGTNDDKAAHEHSDGARLLSEREVDRNEIAPICTEGVVDFSAESIPDQPKCNLVSSLASSTLTLVVPLMRASSPSPPEFDPPIGIHSSYHQPSFHSESIAELRRPVDQVSMITSDVQRTSLYDEEGFLRTSQGKDYVHHDASPIPTKASNPESPTTVFSHSNKFDRNLTQLPEDDFDWGTSFPDIVTSDSGLEEVSRRFKL